MYIDMEKMLRGKSKYTIHKKTDFMNGSIDSTFLTETYGDLNYSKNSITFKMNNEYAGFKTFSFDSESIIIFDFTIKGLQESVSTIGSFEMGIIIGNNSVVIMDNNLIINNDSNNAQMITPYHNAKLAANRLRNYTMRIDKNTNKVSVLEDDQILGSLYVTGLSNYLNGSAYAFFRETKSASSQTNATVRVGAVELKFYC